MQWHIQAILMNILYIIIAADESINRTKYSNEQVLFIHSNSFISVQIVRS